MLNINMLGVHDGLSLQYTAILRKVVGEKKITKVHTRQDRKVV